MTYLLRIILLSFIGVIDLIFMINLFVPILDNNGDLKNWATLLIEAGIFLPIAYYLANLFFKKEEKQREVQKIEHLKKILEKTGEVNRHLENICFWSDPSVSIPVDTLVKHDGEVYDLYLAHTKDVSEILESKLKSAHDSVEPCTKNYSVDEMKKYILTKVWKDYLVLYGHLITSKEIRDSIDMNYHEQRFKRYNKNYGNDLIEMCGLKKYFDEN